MQELATGSCGQAVLQGTPSSVPGRTCKRLRAWYTSLSLPGAPAPACGGRAAWFWVWRWPRHVFGSLIVLCCERQERSAGSRALTNSNISSHSLQSGQRQGGMGAQVRSCLLSELAGGPGPQLLKYKGPQVPASWLSVALLEMQACPGGLEGLEMCECACQDLPQPAAATGLLGK